MVIKPLPIPFDMARFAQGLADIDQWKKPFDLLRGMSLSNGRLVRRCCVNDKLMVDQGVYSSGFL
jgi:hypothetical protein